MLFHPEEISKFHEYTFAHLLLNERGHTLTVTLNRPEKKNALNPVLFNELAFAISYAASNNNIWSVVLKAAGDVFCAGADLKAFAGEQEPTNSTVPKAMAEVVLADVFSSLCKPCLAVVHAPVYAGGFLIVCGCTHVYAAPKATFSLPEVKRGLFPFQVMQSMLEIMPARQVLDFCMRAKTATADEAFSMGLVSKIVAAEKLDAEVDAFCAELEQYSPSAIRLGLQAYNDIKRVPLHERQTFLKQMLSYAVQTEDAAEGIAAFAEKRKPVWTGR